MSRLFIIGNGYDMARRGDTGYLNFKNWLEKYPKNTNTSKYNIAPQSCDGNYLKLFVMPQNEKEENEINELANSMNSGRINITIDLLLLQIPECEWNRFEDYLSHLNLKGAIETLQEKYQFSDNEDITVTPVSRSAEIITSLNSCIHLLFSEWVNSLPSTKETQAVKGAFENQIIKNIQPDDIFIIFNYTTTIEDLYNYSYNEKVFHHPHGIKGYSDSFVFGHNDKKKFDDNAERLEYNNGNSLKSPFTIAFDNNLILDDSEEGYIQSFYQSLYKNPEHVIKTNSNLWESIMKTCENSHLYIYEYGWSCSQVDKDYLEKIISIVKDQNVTLYLNNYGNGADQKAEAWKACGFPEENIKYYTEEKENIIFT